MCFLFRLKGESFCNQSILEESESIPHNTTNISEVAERKAFISLVAKEHGLRGNDLNLMKELRKYRRSDEIGSENKQYKTPRKTKSF